jgi:hypothetical protein
MIRPLTIATFLLACGSGLYLYQSKHEVQLLDRTIEKTVRDTATLREQSRVLAAEWTMLNDPERLRQFSDTYLNLKAIDPKQFTSLADLDTRLPPPQVELPVASADEAPGGTDADAQAGSGADPTSATAAAAVADDEDALPVPPIPATRAAQAVVPVARAETVVPVARAETVVPVARAEAVPSTIRQAEAGSPAARPVEFKVAAARPVATADAKPADQRSTDPRGSSRVAEARSDVRVAAAPPRPIILAAPRPQPVYAQANSQPTRYQPTRYQPAPYQPTPYRAPAPVPAASPYGGSLLGMAHGSMPPAPRPTPVNATYNSN